MKEKTTRVEKRAAVSAAAVITAVGVLVGGLFSSPADLLSEDSPSGTAYSDTLLPDDDAGGDDGDQDDQATEKFRKRSLRAQARERILRLPLAVRLTVLLPLWLIGSAITAAAGALWTAASPLLDGALGFVLRALLLLGAFLLAMKVVFPDLPLKKILNRRSVPLLLLGAAALTAADRILAAVWPEYGAVRQAVASGGFLLILGAAVISFSLREHRRRLARSAQTGAEPAPPPLPDKLRFTDPGGDFSVRTR